MNQFNQFVTPPLPGNCFWAALNGCAIMKSRLDDFLSMDTSYKTFMEYNRELVDFINDNSLPITIEASTT